MSWQADYAEYLFNEACAEDDLRREAEEANQGSEDLPADYDEKLKAKMVQEYRDELKERYAKLG